MDLFKRRHHNKDKEVDSVIGSLIESLEQMSKFLVEIQIAKKMNLSKYISVITNLLQKMPPVQRARQAQLDMQSLLDSAKLIDDSEQVLSDSRSPSSRRP